MPHNRQVLLARRPNGAPVAEDFELVQTDLPEPASGEMLLRTVYLSLDPKDVASGQQLRGTRILCEESVHQRYVGQ